MSEKKMILVEAREWMKKQIKRDGKDSSFAGNIFTDTNDALMTVEEMYKTGAKIVYVELDSNAELDSDVHNYSDTNYSDTLWVQVISDREIEFLRSVLQDGFDEAWFDNKQKMYRFWWD